MFFILFCYYDVRFVRIYTTTPVCVCGYDCVRVLHDTTSTLRVGILARDFSYRPLRIRQTQRVKYVGRLRPGHRKNNERARGSRFERS